MLRGLDKLKFSQKYFLKHPTVSPIPHTFLQAQQVLAAVQGIQFPHSEVRAVRAVPEKYLVYIYRLNNLKSKLMVF